MKKIFVILAMSSVCIMFFLFMKPEITQYEDINGDVQPYTKSNLLEGIDSPKKEKTFYHPITNYKPRVSTLGFSITPPPGDNWYEALKKDSLLYLKINKSHRRYSILTEAREVHISKNIKHSEDLLNYVKSEKEKDLISSNFTNQQVTVQIEASPSKNCVRYSQVYQDHGMRGLQEGRYVNVDIKGVFCLHPDNARIGIDVNYLEKSLSNTETESFSKEGEKFLSSLTFQKVNR